MADILHRYHHLIRYAHWAYKNDDGAEFRSAAFDLHGNVRHRKLVINTPFLKWFLRDLTPNTHLHLGIRGGDTLVLAFRGTDFPFTAENLVNPKRWWGFWGNVWTDVVFRMTRIPWLTGPPSQSVMVHEGFLEAFDNLLENHRLDAAIVGLLGSNAPAKIEVCGHSLGAALATLCALWCRQQWPTSEITCLTIGSPRVGNTAFRQRFNDSNIRYYRLMMDGDPIPTVPDRFTQALPARLPATNPSGSPDNNRYRHVGEPVLLREAGQHGALNDTVQAGIERRDILEEDQAEPLKAWFTLPYKFGGFVPYWLVRGMRMLYGIWHYHDPLGYETVVQRIVEETETPV